MISFMACWMALFTSGMAISDTTSKLLSGISAIHHKRRHAIEKTTQHRVCFRRQSRFIERVVHQLQPAVARGLVNLKRQVAHAKPGMAAFFDVSRRASEAANQKHAQAPFRALQIFTRIHWPENTVTGNLPVKSGNEPVESALADLSINVFFSHAIIV